MANANITFNLFPIKIDESNKEKIYQNNILFTHKNRNILISYVIILISVLLFISEVIFNLNLLQTNFKLTFNSVYNTILQTLIALLLK